MTSATIPTPSDTSGAFACVPQDLLTDGRLLDRDRTLWAYLASKGWRTGEVWRSQHGLGDDLGCSSDSIARSVRRLVAAGWLDVVKRRGVRVLVYLVKGLRRPQPGDGPGDSRRRPRQRGVRTDATRISRGPSDPRERTPHEPDPQTLNPQAVVDAVQAVRPEWGAGGIVASWTRNARRSGSARRTLRALLTAAATAACRTPGVIDRDGWLWT